MAAGKTTRTTSYSVQRIPKCLTFHVSDRAQNESQFLIPPPHLAELASLLPSITTTYACNATTFNYVTIARRGIKEVGRTSALSSFQICFRCYRSQRVPYTSANTVILKHALDHP
ncbi:hypothetical protein K432DRAFT_383264 [Lepidopterella palustris CBS 459.81]|uniref:Uncharacterized protein n=1 Tax=Lepidopterella palustris CBS 459.81 TaxID=1314670 RepID=A0A8E2E8F9_9PEZI|nr:hypothetical protein K432DRAFT_383264 [Lepidopterella palustris CBS 459.81]